MKRSKHIAFCAFLCIIIPICIALSSCSAADIIIKVGENEFSCETSFTEHAGNTEAVVNVSSGTFHLDKECRYAANISEENRKIISCREVQTLLDDGYKPCSFCASEYKKQIGGDNG
ncbi:MAG: hypothetical protein ACI4QR_02480 [Eubacteriales bacterium]